MEEAVGCAGVWRRPPPPLDAAARHMRCSLTGDWGVGSEERGGELGNKEMGIGDLRGRREGVHSQVGWAAPKLSAILRAMPCRPPGLGSSPGTPWSSWPS